MSSNVRPYMLCLIYQISKWAKKALHQTANDWKKAGWLLSAVSIVLPCWIGGIIMVLGLYGITQIIGFYILSRSYSPCQPDGKFSLIWGRYTPWTRSGFFQITLAFGNLNFSQAKAIDVIWDVVRPSHFHIL